MQRVFVVSLMKVEPGGRDAVEDAIVARLASAGVAGVASHTVMSDDAEKPGPTLEEAIKASGADGVLLVEVKAVGAYEPYTVGQTITSLSPGHDGVVQLSQAAERLPARRLQGRAHRERALPAVDGQAGMDGVSPTRYDAVEPRAATCPTYTLKLVDVMAKDRMIAATPKPS